MKTAATCGSRGAQAGWSGAWHAGSPRSPRADREDRPLPAAPRRRRRDPDARPARRSRLCHDRGPVHARRHVAVLHGTVRAGRPPAVRSRSSWSAALLAIGAAARPPDGRRPHRRGGGGPACRIRRPAVGVLPLPAVAPGLPRRLASKRGLYELCREHDVPAPASAFPATPGEIGAFAAQATFPVVAKNLEAWVRRRAPVVPGTTVLATPQELLCAGPGLGRDCRA